jgi:hypothetical protein
VLDDATNMITSCSSVLKNITEFETALDYFIILSDLKSNAMERKKCFCNKGADLNVK